MAPGVIAEDGVDFQQANQKDQPAAQLVEEGSYRRYLDSLRKELYAGLNRVTKNEITTYTEQVALAAFNSVPSTASRPPSVANSSSGRVASHSSCSE